MRLLHKNRSLCKINVPHFTTTERTMITGAITHRQEIQEQKDAITESALSFNMSGSQPTGKLLLDSTTVSSPNSPGSWRATKNCSGTQIKWWPLCLERIRRRCRPERQTIGCNSTATTTNALCCPNEKSRHQCIALFSAFALGGVMNNTFVIFLDILGRDPEFSNKKHCNSVVDTPEALQHCTP